MASTDMTSFPDAIAEEMKKFQGTWKQIAYERDGVTEPLDEQGWEPRVTFTGDTFVVTLADGSVPIRGTYTIDLTRNPKTVDWADTIANRGLGSAAAAVLHLPLRSVIMELPRNPRRLRCPRR